MMEREKNKGNSIKKNRIYNIKLKHNKYQSLKIKTALVDSQTCLSINCKTNN